MIIIIGCSGSGKSTIEKELVKLGYNNIVSYTTRPIRANETNHKDYHFIDDKEFHQLLSDEFFGEHTNYNSWNYGIAKKDFQSNAIAVVEPYGFRQIKNISKQDKFPILSLFIDVPERVRLKRMVDRGDNLMEIFRRIFSDQGVFQGLQEEVDYVIDNDRDINKTISEILLCISQGG
jgi:guanylate kinase